MPRANESDSVLKGVIDKFLPWAVVGIFATAIGGYIDLQWFKRLASELERRLAVVETKVSEVEAKTLSREELVEVLKEARQQGKHEATGG